MDDVMDDAIKNAIEKTDSIKIGTPSKGGEIKLYGSFDDPVAFKKKIDNAKIVKAYAQANIAVNV